MAYITTLQTSSLSNQNIATALQIASFTNTTRQRKLYITAFADQIAGNGNYVIYAKRQLAGAGSAYEIGARTTVAVPSGVTAQAFPTIALMAEVGDVITVFLVGLAGDTTTPDTIVKFAEEFIATDADGRAGLDWSNIGAPTTAQNLSGTNIDADQVVASVTGNVGGNVVGSVGSVVAGVTLVAGQILVKRNTALNEFMFQMVSSTTGEPVTGLTVTATRNIDNAGFAAAANAVTEIGNGWYVIDMAASDLNGIVIAWNMAATGAKTRGFTIVTQA